MFQAATRTHYATDRFRVLHHRLAAGERLTATAGAGKTLWIPITSGLTASVNGRDTGPLQPGALIAIDPGASYAIANPAAQPAEYLTVAWDAVAQGDRKPLEEVTETRPWGSFTVLADEPHFKLKQLWVKPGNRLSLQRHRQREEHWFVTAGQPEITIDSQVLRKQPGDYVQIPLQAWHRLANPAGAAEGVEIIELQLGAYFGEDDIERRDDDYGRA